MEIGPRIREEGEGDGALGQVARGADCSCRLTRPSVGQSVGGISGQSLDGCNLRFLQSQSSFPSESNHCPLIAMQCTTSISIVYMQQMCVLYSVYSVYSVPYRSFLLPCIWSIFAANMQYIYLDDVSIPLMRWVKPLDLNCLAGPLISEFDINFH